MELVDTRDLKSLEGNFVPVRVRPRAPYHQMMDYFFISLIVSITTYILCLAYRKVAIKKGVLANLNFRTLHDEVTPKGGGIVFPIIFLLSISILYIYNFDIDHDNFYSALCALFLSLFGLWDDYREVRASFKFLIQTTFSLLALSIFLPLELLFVDILLFTLFLFLLVTFIWIINTINFMDGIDGLAASLACFYFFMTFLISLLTNEIMPLLENLIIFSTCLGFLFINFSNKNLFMGDAGSLFLGFMISFICIETIYEGTFSVWYWLILLSYCLTETIATTFYRVIFIKKWYGAHRSHAYQNLARIKKNHWKVTLTIIIYHLLWIMPLALLALFSNFSPLILLLMAILPTLIFNLFFGPRFSSK